MLVVAGALLYLAGCGTTFFNGDDLTQITTISWSPNAMLAPSTGNLILVSRLGFHAVASLFGPDYGVLRALGVAGVLAVDLTAFFLLRRRVGSGIALAGTIVIAFLGAAWEAILWPGAQLSLVYSLAAGLGALLALEEPGRRRDAIASGLLLVSLASVSLGLCFTIGVGASVLAREDRWRRAWIFVVPLALWVAWWIWSAKFGQSQGSVSNLPGVPLYDVKSLVAVVASLGGIVGFSGAVGFDTAPARTAVGSAVAVVLVAGFAALVLWRTEVGGALRRYRFRATMLPPLLTLLCFWSLAGLAGGSHRPPQASRYMLPGAVLLLLVIAEAIRGVEISRRSLRLLLAGAVAIAALNVPVLIHASDFFRDYSENAKAQLAMIELERGRVDPSLNPALANPAAAGRYLNVTASAYLEAAAHYGSFADSIPQVEASPEQVRERADQLLGTILSPRARPAGANPPRRSCRILPGPAAAANGSVPLPPGAALLRSRRATFAALGRFGARPTAGFAGLPAGGWERLSLPPDAAHRPWRVGAKESGGLTVCASRA